jgi:hypothetical protein
MSFTFTEKLTVVHCICGLPFAIPDTLNEQALDRKTDIYCPRGHLWHYTGKTDAERLAEEKRRHQATKDLLAQEERSHRSTRGELTKVRKRVAAGVCPCCKRHFVNLERHMQGKHPDFKPEGATT